MGDIKLFRLKKTNAEELTGKSATIEKSLQTLVEKHLETFLGVRFLATEYSTTNGGRMDTLGIDENGCPVIIEYKRSTNENVINQGLFYLDWLMDHKASFTLLVQEKLGKKVSESVEWTNPRLLCIAGDFTKYDEHAVNQMNRNIELLRYRNFSDDLILFELVNSATAQTTTKPPIGKGTTKTVTAYLAGADVKLKDLYESVKAFLQALGDDVQMKPMQNYFAFRRIKNFACVEVHPQKKSLTVFVKVDPRLIKIEKGFTRDMRKTGHFGTGDLEITIKNDNDLEKAKPLFLQSYEAS
jgi:predicted transport protein